ncbi:hypothetical protein D3C77_369200 [compost metagenome]
MVPEVGNAGGVLEQVEDGHVLPTARRIAEVGGHLIVDIKLAHLHKLENGHGGKRLGDLTYVPDGFD